MRLIAIFILAFSFGANAQTASNFNINDIDGVNRDLFMELDNGNIVVLKFFTNWCGICNNTADEVVDIYNGYQTNGDPVVFWALDRDPNETNVQATTYRNNNSIPFPVIGEASAVAAQFGVQYQPEYYIVRPDRSYVKQTNYSSMQTAVNEALASSSTGIIDTELKAKVEVTNNSFVWNGETTKTAEMKIVDASGRVTLRKTINAREKISLNYPTGVYVYTLRTENGATAVGKIGIVD